MRLGIGFSIVLGPDDAGAAADGSDALLPPLISSDRIESMLFEMTRRGGAVQGLSFTEANAALAFFSDGLPLLARLLGRNAGERLLQFRQGRSTGRSGRRCAKAAAPVPVPEVGTGSALAAGLLVLALRRRRSAGGRAAT